MTTDGAVPDRDRPWLNGDAEIVVDPDGFLRYDRALGRRVLVAGSHRLRVGVNALDPGDALTVTTGPQVAPAVAVR